jgi:hypothetical protein
VYGEKRATYTSYHVRLIRSMKDITNGICIVDDVTHLEMVIPFQPLLMAPFGDPQAFLRPIS